MLLFTIIIIIITTIIIIIIIIIIILIIIIFIIIRIKESVSHRATISKREVKFFTYSVPTHLNHYKQISRLFNHTRKKKMPSLSTKERKAKLLVAIKEFNDRLLNVVRSSMKWKKFILKINKNDLILS